MYAKVKSTLVWVNIELDFSIELGSMNMESPRVWGILVQ